MTDFTENYGKWLKERKKPKYCLVCKKEMKITSMGGGSLDFLNLGNDVFYCKNKKCDRFGVITVGYAPKKK